MPRFSYHMMRAMTLLLGLLMACHVQAATKTWTGTSSNAWGTAANWSSSSTPSSSDDLLFNGTTNLTTDAATGSWNWYFNSLTFGPSAGSYVISGGGLHIGTGGITNNSFNAQTITSQITLTADQTWNAASGAIVTGTSYFNANSKNLTLTGSSAITIGGQIGNAATLTLAGSGNRTISGQIAASTINVASTGTNTFSSQINVGTLNISGGNTTIANAQVTSGTTISGNANVNFAGPVTGGGGINLNTSGNVNFSGSINSGSLTLNGSGTTTISGNGSMSTGAVVVNNGTLVMDHTGTAINSTLTVNNGGTVVFAQDNQIPAWQTVTLNEGSTLLLGDTTQTFANLIITGDCVIDFGEEGSQLNVQSWGNISIADDITITIINWDESKGDVFAGNNPGTSVVHIQYADSNGNVYATGTWGGGLITPGAPVPEPATYGFIMLGSGIVFFIWRRWKAAREQAHHA